MYYTTLMTTAHSKFLLGFLFSTTYTATFDTLRRPPVGVLEDSTRLIYNLLVGELVSLDRTPFSCPRGTVVLWEAGIVFLVYVMRRPFCFLLAGVYGRREKGFDLSKLGFAFASRCPDTETGSLGSSLAREWLNCMK